MSREKEVFLAGLACKAGRFQDMMEHMLVVASFSQELSREERNLLSIACRSNVDSIRSSLNSIHSFTDADAPDLERDPPSPATQWFYAAEYRSHLLAELYQTCGTIIATLDNMLIPQASMAESRVFYQTMKADNHRYSVDFLDGVAREQTIRWARLAYEEAWDLAQNSMLVTHPIRLSVALNYSVFMYELLEQRNDAYTMAREARRLAVDALGCVAEASRPDAEQLLLRLEANLDRWSELYPVAAAVKQGQRQLRLTSAGGNKHRGSHRGSGGRGGGSGVGKSQ